MSTLTVGAVIMVGRGGPSVPERLLFQAAQAAASDLITMLGREGVAPLIVAGAEVPGTAESACYIYDPDRGAFHFGERLAELVERYRLPAVMYFGAASAPLLPCGIVAHVHSALGQALLHSSQPRLAFTNNVHSSDWVAFTVVRDTVPLLRRVNRDNSLAWVLREEGGYQVFCPPEMRPAWGVDLDTPADLAIVREHPDCSPQVRLACQDVLLDRIPVPALLDVLARDGSRVALIGRVAPLAWHALNQVSQCWMRVFSEERGMVASERLARGEVQSLVARLVEETGLRSFFDELARLVDAAILDSRVLMAALGHYPGPADRFASDLYLAETIADEWLREFTEAARATPIPIVLGGHSVVAGGLHVLAELVAKRRAR